MQIKRGLKGRPSPPTPARSSVRALRLRPAAGRPGEDAVRTPEGGASEGASPAKSTRHPGLPARGGIRKQISAGQGTLGRRNRAAPRQTVVLPLKSASSPLPLRFSVHQGCALTRCPRFLFLTKLIPKGCPLQWPWVYSLPKKKKKGRRRKENPWFRILSIPRISQKPLP